MQTTGFKQRSTKQTTQQQKTNMSKNQKASGITNIINYDNSGNISFVSGSTTLMSVSSSGAVVLTGTMSGGTADSASLSANSNLLQGTGSIGFATTASLERIDQIQKA